MPEVPRTTVQLLASALPPRTFTYPEPLISGATRRTAPPPPPPPLNTPLPSPPFAKIEPFTVIETVLAMSRAPPPPPPPPEPDEYSELGPPPEPPINGTKN